MTTRRHSATEILLTHFAGLNEEGLGRKKSPYPSLVERQLQRNYFRQSNRILGTLDIEDVLYLSFRFLISRSSR